ncbi:hypothetical protein G1H11_09900 [Phytoactinopolyspora alkaliphila]|uniref:Uncharacterized protein n=1 Tax=Phytoactinopolyspora alkaliphila TaxID=1783498 RepID=A0A6N9YKZ5_9ACTN|nr:hypothetical protein [Phytoactinopolyspora alkaliphila]NED95625.1 hypothetical protein [Phytoactinopolyspora alkaliphila]
MTLTIDRRFRGPASSGNGGYVAGRLAGYLDADAVTVTLRRPPPLEVPLDVRVDAGGVVLLLDPAGEGETDDATAASMPAASAPGHVTVAEAAPADESALVAVPAVGEHDAREISRAYPGLREHPFPECFVCGTRRRAGDGMRLFPGRLGDGRTACVWTVDEDLAADPCFVWSALDCPGGWSAPIEGRPMVLGRVTAQVDDVPAAGESCVVMGRLLGTEGRKTWTATTVYGADGRRLGSAHATWITIGSAR